MAYRKTAMVYKDRALEARDGVHDEASFIAFLRALYEDWEVQEELERANPSPPYSSGALGWENGTIGRFLEAACAWAETSGRGHTLHYTLPENAWRRCADIIYSGKVIE